MIKGKFIVLEGIEGSGKTLACQIVLKTLKKHNIKNIKLVKEPGSTYLGEKIRKIIKNYNNKQNLNNSAELLLFYAARIQLVESIIKPALNKGIWVISDRYQLSSFAYQGGGYNIPLKKIKILKTMFLKKIDPDLTFYLDVFPKVGLKRASRRSSLDRIEKNSINFFNKIRNTYLNIISKEKKIIKINANQKKDLVKKSIKNELYIWLKSN
ncbi:dTMP kinase [Buchnera aphidicola (Mindarus keteleerifoliae)]|uniref:dTMP kinase n=1 Tax=Buchnera aphidicola TaxID=9 RepID=UPI0031B67F8B